MNYVYGLVLSERVTWALRHCMTCASLMGLSIPSEDYAKKEGNLPLNESSVKLMNMASDYNDGESSISSDQSSISLKKPDRATWIGRMDFLLSCVGYAVGLGNVWRFPFLCYTSGGGAFLIPYVIFLVLCGMPLFMLELSFGQFASRGPITIWNICPLFKGLGYGMVIISGMVCIYYNIIITWILYYMFLSFNKVLPWSTCDNWWNTDRCYLRHHNSSTQAINISSTLEQFNSSTNLSAVTAVSSMATNATSVAQSTASDEFWLYYVLQISKGIDDLGGIRMELFYCLIVAWIVIFLCLFKGVKSSGRVVYFSATFPYIVLIILFIRGVTLPGAMEGIKFYLSPDWNKLLTFRVWGNAAVQIFYSLGPAWGGLLTMSSYNKFHNNVYRDALMVPIINCGTSVFAGLVIFSVIGFMSHVTNSPIEKVVSQGPGLAFVVYPEAVTKLPISPLWAFLFFFMIFTVGLDSQVPFYFMYYFIKKSVLIPIKNVR
ncbi:Sodium- and chloride-dependent glycine transporter 1 [Nymphon striatum]|nr:Sodium- and chloride-dependent glycine transporter 1 [Nymphon striatum]KAG1654096.1 Sodium- and chloride-dependent glycine transporter 1 [Nymphon striatum]